MKGEFTMKRLTLACIVGIVASTLVAINDLLNYFTNLGNFAWIAFVIWSFTLARWDEVEEDNDTKRMQYFMWRIIGIPLGIILGWAMIFVPTCFDGNLIVKYAMVFIANSTAMLLPSKTTYGIFFGISFVFSGLGIGMIPDSIERAFIMLGIIVIYTLLGTLCPFAVNKIYKIVNK